MALSMTAMFETNHGDGVIVEHQLIRGCACDLVLCLDQLGRDSTHGLGKRLGSVEIH